MIWIRFESFLNIYEFRAQFYEKLGPPVISEPANIVIYCGNDHFDLKCIPGISFKLVLMASRSLTHDP